MCATTNGRHQMRRATSCTGQNFRRTFLSFSTHGNDHCHSILGKHGDTIFQHGYLFVLPGRTLLSSDENALSYLSDFCSYFDIYGQSSAVLAANVYLPSFRIPAITPHSLISAHHSLRIPRPDDAIRCGVCLFLSIGLNELFIQIQIHILLKQHNCTKSSNRGYFYPRSLTQPRCKRQADPPR